MSNRHLAAFVNSKTQHLVFSAQVYPDGNLSSVPAQDESWENRGNSALVYDETYVRHWDEWRGPKSSQLFSTTLKVDGGSGVWALDQDFKSPLKGTKHVSGYRFRWGVDVLISLGFEACASGAFWWYR